MSEQTLDEQAVALWRPSDQHPWREWESDKSEVQGELRDFVPQGAVEEMAKADEYNGYTNRETWATSMFLDGNYDPDGVQVHEAVAILAAEAVRESKQRFQGREVVAQRILADRLTEFVKHTNNPPASGLAADLLGSAFGRVDWLELAELKLDEYRETDD